MALAAHSGGALARGCHQTSSGGRPSSSSRGHTVAPPARPWSRAVRTAQAFHGRTAPSGLADKKIKLSFKLPYRTHFGQDIAIVGSSADLGEWDPREAVSMRWSDGDVWECELEVSAGPHLELEYKYVIRDPDGGVSLWKPGSNFKLDVALDGAAAAPGAAPGGLAVCDAWDGSVRDVRVEVTEAGRPARPMSDTEREQMAFRESLVSALDELSSQIGEAETIGSSVEDPTSPEVLQADRLVAAAARKAVAVAHALNAAQEQARLAAPADDNLP